MIGLSIHIMCSIIFQKNVFLIYLYFQIYIYLIIDQHCIISITNLWTACGTDGPDVRALNLHQCLWTHLQVYGSKRLGCHADFYTVSRSCTRGESEESIVHRWGSMQARDPPWLWNPEQTSPEVQNRVSLAPRKGLMSLKNFIKKKPSQMSEIFLDVLQHDQNGQQIPFPIIVTFKSYIVTVFNIYAFQSFLDLAVSIVLLLTSLTIRNAYVVRTTGLWASIECGMWNSKLLLWGFLISSTWNIVAGTFER